MSERPIFDLDEVGKILGVTGRTISRYMTHSRSGGRYADRPFPEPDGRAGHSPFWLRTRFDEIWDWHKGRPGRGAGGGRPSHRQVQEVHQEHERQ